MTRPPAENGVPCPLVVATILRPVGETGIQTYVSELRRVMAARGRVVPLVTPFAASPALVAPVFGVRRLLDPLSGTASVWWYRQWHRRLLTRALRGVLDGPRQQVIYAQCPLSALAAMEARATRRQPVVMMVNYNLSQADEWAEKRRIPYGGRLYRAIVATERRVLPALDGIVYASQFSRGQVPPRVPELAAVTTAVVPNFVADREGPAGHDDAAGADLVTVGTLERRKNQAHVLRVVAAAGAMGHRYSLSVVGDGPDRGALDDLARELGIRSQVRFLGFRRDARSLLARHRAYVHSAHIENCPLVLIEAMAAGLPVFARPTGGIPEMVRDGVEGVLWSSHDVESCARSLVTVLEDPQRAAAMSRRARERFQTNYEASAVVPALERFLCDRLRER